MQNRGLGAPRPRFGAAPTGMETRCSDAARGRDALSLAGHPPSRRQPTRSHTHAAAA